MATLTVFLAPDGPAAGVLDVLTDLSAAGLVADFLWVVDADVDVDEYGGGIRDVPAVRVRSGRSSELTVQAALAELPHDRCRLCVVVPVSDDAAVDSAVEQQMSDLVAFADLQIPTTRVRVVVARPGDHAPHHVLSRNGWHNVYLAPEEAYGPARPAQLLSPDADPVELGRFAAPAVAGLVGLWTGVDATPLDDPHTPDGVRLGRAFYRRIDARAVEAELRSRVLSTRAPLPEPSGQVAHAIYLPDPGRACWEMTGKWWRVHEKTLVGPRQQPERPEPLPTGLRAMLKMFFQFLGAALRNAPYDLIEGGKIIAKAAIARRVHHLVLGSSDSVYKVVVDGVDRERKPVSWRRIGTDVRLIDGRLAADGVAGAIDQQQEKPDLRKMWSDFADGAMTLVDGGERTLPAVPVGANVGVLRAAADAAAPPDQDFRVPGQFTDEVGTARLPVGDVLGAEDLRRQLRYVLENHDHTRAPEATGALHDLDAWQERHHHTYSGQVGGVLAQRLREMIAEIGQHLKFLQEAAAVLAPAAASPSRGRVWATRLLAVLALIGLVAAPILAVRDDVSLRVALLIGLLPLLGLALRRDLRVHPGTAGGLPGHQPAPGARIPGGGGAREPAAGRHRRRPARRRLRPVPGVEPRDRRAAEPAVRASTPGRGRRRGHHLRPAPHHPSRPGGGRRAHDRRRRSGAAVRPVPPRLARRTVGRAPRRSRGPAQLLPAPGAAAGAAGPARRGGRLGPAALGGPARRREPRPVRGPW